MSKRKNILISFPESDIEKLNQLKGNISRSECIRHSVRHYFDICSTGTCIIKNPLDNKYYKVTMQKLTEEPTE